MSMDSVRAWGCWPASWSGSSSPSSSGNGNSDERTMHSSRAWTAYRPALPGVTEPQRLLAFDIETAKPLPDEVTDLLSHRPLGIACAAAVDIEGQHEVLWHGRKAGTFAAQMSRWEAQRLVHDLVGFVEGGYTLVTWNGVGFDFNILAEESGLLGECASLALAHIDLMFHIVCSRGFPLALDKVAQGMELPGKPSGMSGSKAPTLWASGHQADVLGYVVGDCRCAGRPSARGAGGVRNFVCELLPLVSPPA